jgi:hypothetical protein
LTVTHSLNFPSLSSQPSHHFLFSSRSTATHGNHPKPTHQQPPKTHSRLLNHCNHPKPTHASSTTATTHNPHTHAGKPKPKPKPTTTIPTSANPNPPQPILSATTLATHDPLINNHLKPTHASLTTAITQNPLMTPQPRQPPITPTPTPANPNPQPPYPCRQTQTHHNPFCLQPRRRPTTHTPRPPKPMYRNLFKDENKGLDGVGGGWGTD